MRRKARTATAATVGLCALVAAAGCSSTAEISRGVTVSEASLAPGPGGWVEGGTSAPGGFVGSSAGTPISGSGVATGPLGGSTPSAGPMSSAGAPGGRATTAIPRTGVGWDAKTVYIGVPTEEDVHRYAGSLGINFDPGSVEADVRAVVADLNARGGLFGRRIVPVFHDNATADLQADPDRAAQENCTFFTEDHRVVAVLNAIPILDTENWHACLQRHHTPLLTGTSVLYDDEAAKNYGPHVWSTLMPNMTGFAADWMTHLRREQYFVGWNTTLGAPGSAPAKVGILMPDTAVSQRLTKVMAARLRQLGVPVASDYAYQDSIASYGGDMSAAVLRFKAAGVTHVLSLPPIALALGVFMQTAEQQRYRPRYALSSVTVATPLAANVPKEQLKGSLGIGWVPGIDVDDAHDPGRSPAQRECEAALKRGGLSFAGDADRTALSVAFAVCDLVKLVVQGTRRSGGLSPEHLARGIAEVGPSFLPAATFGSGLGSKSRFLPDVVRDLHYDTACSCFRYRGGGQQL